MCQYADPHDRLESLVQTQCPSYLLTQKTAVPPTGSAGKYPAISNAPRLLRGVQGKRPCFSRPLKL